MTTSKSQTQDWTGHLSGCAETMTSVTNSGRHAVEEGLDHEAEVVPRIKAERVDEVEHPRKK